MPKHTASERRKKRAFGESSSFSLSERLGFSKPKPAKKKKKRTSHNSTHKGGKLPKA